MDSIQRFFFFLHTHSRTDAGVNNARRQPARQEQLGLGVLLRDTSTLLSNN